jgi:DNA-binding beta-propeller fold protein YncE
MHGSFPIGRIQPGKLVVDHDAHTVFITGHMIFQTDVWIIDVPHNTTLIKADA